MWIDFRWAQRLSPDQIAENNANSYEQQGRLIKNSNGYEKVAQRKG